MVLPPKDAAFVTDLVRNASTWWDGKGDPIDYVVSKNLKRRHLTASQPTMVGDKIAKPAHRWQSANLRIGNTYSSRGG
jgi:hypothetical protein